MLFLCLKTYGYEAQIIENKGFYHDDLQLLTLELREKTFFKCIEYVFSISYNSDVYIPAKYNLEHAYCCAQNITKLEGA